jgi:exosortase H (IPTLxxWG-CTERM-specific)
VGHGRVAQIQVAPAPPPRGRGGIFSTAGRRDGAADGTGLFEGIGVGRFLLVFFSLQAVLFGIELTQPVQQYVVLPWTSLLARFCVALVTLFDADAAAIGKVLWNPSTGFGVSIEPGCNGVEACIVLFAALVAYPATWKYRAWGFAIGFVAVQALNVVRVVSLFYLGQWNDAVFRVFHEYLWQALIMIDVLVVWLLWVRANPEHARAAAAAA